MININPSTHIITIPQLDLTPLGGTSYQLDTYALHIMLKDWEDGEDGIYQPKTHNHNTVVTLGGIQYARIVEVLSPYTITFENVGSAYKVFLSGSNNNILDVTNLNNVSVAPNNSAGLINVVEVQFAAFNNEVVIDVLNGTSGIVYPKGTSADPVNNLLDALTIADARGFSRLSIKGNLTLADGDDVGGYTLVGEDASSTMITMSAGCITLVAKMKNLTLKGVCGGRMDITDCHVHQITKLCASGGDANLVRCMLGESIQLRSQANMSFNFINCYGSSGAQEPILDVNHCTASLNFSDYSGHLSLQNVTQPTQLINMDINSGHITLSSTVTQGTISLGGIAKLSNNTTSQTGLTIDTTGLMTPATLEHMAFGEMVHFDPVNGVTGQDYPVGTHRYPSNNYADAKAIAIERGFPGFHLAPTTVTFSDTDSLDAYTFQGVGIENTKVVLTQGCTTSKTTFRDLTASGFQDGETHYERCEILALSGIHCRFIDCLLRGPMTVEEGTYADTTVLTNCYTGYDKNIVSPALKDELVIDLNNSSVNMTFSNFYGKVKFINLNRSTTPPTIILNMGAGKVTVDSSCTTGTIKVRGIAELIDNSTGTSVDNDAVYPTALTSGALTLEQSNMLTDLHNEAFGKWVVDPLGKTLTLYNPDNSILKVFDLADTNVNVPAFISRTPQ